jgi:alpha-ribazole phosphatase
MELLLIRHGETIGNLQKRYVGRTDEPLCEQGKEHARKQAHAWTQVAGAKTSSPIRQVHVSPLLRATQTAAILFPAAQQLIVEEFREMDFGDFDGRGFDELNADVLYRAWVDGLCEAPCPGGESRMTFDSRVQGAFLSLMTHALQARDDRLIIVAHGGTIMSLMGRWARPARLFYEWYVPNCGGYHIHIDRKQWEHEGVFANPRLFDL